MTNFQCTSMFNDINFDINLDLLLQIKWTTVFDTTHFDWCYPYPFTMCIDPWQFSARTLSRRLEHKWHADTTDLCPWLRWATPQTGGENALFFCQISAVDLFLHADLDFDIIDPVVALHVEKRKKEETSSVASFVFLNCSHCCGVQDLLTDPGLLLQNR